MSIEFTTPYFDAEPSEYILEPIHNVIDGIVEIAIEGEHIGTGFEQDWHDAIIVVVRCNVERRPPVHVFGVFVGT